MNPSPAAILVPVLNSATALSGNLHFELNYQANEATFHLSLQSTILLTKRSPDLPHHPGQISFPGGMPESSDISLIATALRETQEEVGIDPDSIKCIDELPVVHTNTSNFAISPFVGLIPGTPHFSVNSREISELIFVPITYLLSPENCRRQIYQVQGHSIELPVYSYENHVIWGATAVILESFLTRINPRRIEL